MSSIPCQRSTSNSSTTTDSTVEWLHLIDSLTGESDEFSRRAPSCTVPPSPAVLPGASDMFSSLADIPISCQFFPTTFTSSYGVAAFDPSQQGDPWIDDLAASVGLVAQPNYFGCLGFNTSLDPPALEYEARSVSDSTATTGSNASVSVDEEPRRLYSGFVEAAVEPLPHPFPMPEMRRSPEVGPRRRPLPMRACKRDVPLQESLQCPARCTVSVTKSVSAAPITTPPSDDAQNVEPGDIHWHEHSQGTQYWVYQKENTWKEVELGSRHPTWPQRRLRHNNPNASRAKSPTWVLEKSDKYYSDMYRRKKERGTRNPVRGTKDDAHE